MKSTKLIFTAFATMLAFVTQAQVSVINTQLSEYNISATSLSRVNVMNGLSQTMEVTLIGQLKNSQGELILEFQSFPFSISPGFNSSQSLRMQLANSSYGYSEQAKYVKNRKMLPSGNYLYCYKLMTSVGTEPLEDNCDEIESQKSDFLTLIYPADEDVIDTKNPVLTWSHSEPFNILLPNDHFLLRLVEVDEGQSANEALSNNPILYRKKMRSHQVPYPFNAQELMPGKNYAWQVSQVSNQSIVNQSDVWSFSIKKEKEPEAKKYTVMKPKNQARFHELNSNLLYFSFNEDYFSSSKSLKYHIFDDNQKQILGVANRDDATNANVKKTGKNKFVLDLSKSGLKKGMYTLVSYDEKGNKFYLKFYFDE